VPRDDRLEALVEVDVGPDRVVRDPAAERAEPLDRPVAFPRREVVEDRPRHQAPRRPHARLRLDLGDANGRDEGEVDVVADDQVAWLRRPVEPHDPVAARLRGLEQLAVVREREPARRRHAGSTSISASSDAASARAIASLRVSPVVIT
jgi:hypothetical protein